MPWNFWLGLVGFFSMTFLVPVIMGWMRHNPWRRYQVAGVLMIATLGFGSALLMRSPEIRVSADCFRYGTRADDLCY